jgi:metal-responsive CopG/Arc/MetJ family transcriptional regulator
MRTTQTMTVSLPPQIMDYLESYRQKHGFTRSELIRHALRELLDKQSPSISGQIRLDRQVKNKKAK